MLHAMIDIETASTRKNAIVATFGAVKFSNEIEEPYDPLYLKPSIDEQSELGRHLDDNTIEWWATQDDEVRGDTFSIDDRISLYEFFRIIKKWLIGVNYIWSYGSNFDFPILETLCLDLQRPILWDYRKIRDARTLLWLHQIDTRRDDGSVHNALADAYYQAEFVRKILLDIKG